MSEGARFQIVLVDETPPDSQQARPDTGPSPPPFVQPPPVVSTTTSTPQQKPTDRPAPLADSATPVKGRADRSPNESEQKSDSRKDFDRVTKAAVSIDDIIGTGGLVRKAIAIVDVARTVIEGINAAKRLSDKPTAPQAVAESGALQEDPEGFANTLKDAIEKHTGAAKPDPQAKAPEAPPVQPPPVQAPAVQPPPAQVPPVTAKAPEAPPVQVPSVTAKAPSVQVPPATAKAPPVEIPTVTAKAPEIPPVTPPQVQAPPATVKAPEARPATVESVDGGFTRKAVGMVDAARLVVEGLTAVAKRFFDKPGSPQAAAENPGVMSEESEGPAGSIKEPLERIAANTNPANLDKQADRIIDGLDGDTQPKPEPKPKAPEPPQPRAAKPEAKAPEKSDSGIQIPKVKSSDLKPETATRGVQAEAAGARAVASTEAAAGATAAAESTAVAATETAVALEGVSAASAGTMASLGAVAVAAAPVAIALLAVGAAAYKVYDEFKKTWNTAREQQEELAQYSDAIAVQQAETQVRREMRMVERANELGERLARVGEAQDRNDEAWQKLSDAFDDIMVRALDAIVPAIDAVTVVVNQVAEGIELGNATGQMVLAALQDWLNLAGTEAEQDKAYYEAEALFKKKWNAFFTADQRSKEDQKFMNDPMLQALNNAWGQNKPIDPKDIANMVAQVRNL